MSITVELHDGRQLEFPDGTDTAVIQKTVKGLLAPQPKTGAAQQTVNAGAGLVRGAGSIGATLLAPIDVLKDLAAGKGLSLESNRARRASMDWSLGDLGADTDSFAYGAGKLGGEVAGTAGAGGALANTLGRLPGVAARAPNLLEAIRTAGMVSKAPGAATNALIRAAGGAVTGGASVGLVDPEYAGSGAGIGAALPGVVQIAGKAGNLINEKVLRPSAEKLMQSAIKPTIKQLQSGDAQTAIQALLDYGINPTKNGVEKLRALVDDLNSQISGKIAASSATVPKSDVLGALAGVRAKFGNQVSPTADLAAIQRVADDFAGHPAIVPDIPVQVAQEMKQGTYRVLNGKYGQLGSAETEAQKALARGLKEGVGKAVPDVIPLNAEEARLLKTLNVAERRALMELNKNPVGLGALASDPAGLVAFLADRSAAFKSLAARMVNSAANANSNQLLLSAASNPALRNAAIISAEANP
jgi:hypothetical protein